MDRQWLQERVATLKIRLMQFDKRHQQLKVFYALSLPHITDPAVRSRFVENYSIHINRHHRSFQKMTRIYQHAVKQLSEFSRP